MRCLLLLLCLSTPAAAQDWAQLDGDTALSRAQVVALTDGRVLTFYDNGQSRYDAGGAYSYTYDGGGTAHGAFTIDAAGTVCIEFRNGRSRCDRFVRSHGRVVLLTEKGERFPVRP